MKLLKNMRIRNKIIFIILFIGVLSTITGNVISYLYFIHNTRQQLISTTLLQARLISEYCGLPMEFNYPDNANDALHKLRSIPDIYDGVLYTLDDSVFAAYHKTRDTVIEVPFQLKNQNSFFEGNYLHVVNPIVYKDKKYGYVYLRSNINWRSIFKQQFQVTLITISVMLIIIIVLAFILQRSISYPIIRLTEKMKLVARNKDFSVQFKNNGRDEIGELYGGFNTMLSEIKKRESELTTTLESLKYSEERFRNLAERIPIPICVMDQNGTITYRNQSFIIVFGYTPEEAKNFNDWTVKAFPDGTYRELLQSRWNQAFIEAKKENKPIEPLEYQITCKNLEVRIVEISGIIMENSILLTFFDLTERNQNERILKEQNEKIESQNQELLLANQELFDAKELAVESDRLKTAFLQNMSHEIRSPMNAIMGFADLLVEQYDNRAKLEQYAQIITQRSNDLLHIINDILDIAKIESGQLSLKLGPCNLHELFNELSLFFTEQQRKIGKTHIKFWMQADCKLNKGVILTDKVKLNQIFINLIGNAFKFTDHGIIEVGCRCESDQKILFYVSDTGIGIPENMKEHIFERFVQVSQSSNKVYGGTGLGLSIVKGLIELLGGNLWLESKANFGTTFYFTIPYCEATPESPEPIIHLERPIDFGNKQILVVEDDEFNYSYLREVLSVAGLNVVSAGFGNEAIRIATEQPIDLILMDIRLPDMDGYTATQQIKIQKPDIKIIAQTAYATPGDRQKAFDVGCDDYISKPINRELLLSMLNKHLRS